MRVTKESMNKQSPLYKRVRLFILSILYEVPVTKKWAYRRLPKHKAGYGEYWVNTEGKNYRSTTLRHDQEHNTMRFYPPVSELKKTLAAHNPSKILDIGCGYGKYLEVLVPEFDVEGCDISEELLSQVRSDLRSRVFQLDIVSPPPGWVESHTQAWDVVCCWGVMMYFIDNKAQMVAAMQHMEAIANKKVVVWEWKHICDYMREVYPSGAFEYHYIPVWAAS